MKYTVANLERATPFIILIVFGGAAVFWFLGYKTAYQNTLFFLLIFGTIPFLRDMITSFINRKFGVDLIAAVAILASLVAGEYLGGAVILLMLSGGEWLEDYAVRKAKKELTALLENAPTTALRKIGETLKEIKVEEVKIGDTLVVRPNQIVPVDGIVLTGKSMVDESALTGESLSVEKEIHSTLYSGTLNQSAVLEIKATSTSATSKYQQIIRLVSQAEDQKAPFIRLADRYSVWFTALAFGLAALAWFLSQELVRALEVLVVATPCPLILAAPIAFTAGISRAAKIGIIIKHGGAIEALAEAKVMLFDKTGTLTFGVPKVSKIVSALPEISIKKALSLAASLEQLSTHMLAQALLQEAKNSKVSFTYPTQFAETIGEGVMGKIDNEEYVFGKLSFLKSKGIRISAEIMAQHEAAKKNGQITIYLGHKKTLLAHFYVADTVRPGMKAIFKRLQKHIKKIVMASGDSKLVAERIATEVGIVNVVAPCLPEEKVGVIKNLQAEFRPVVMIGDGVNDAPALAAADCGITLGARGSTAAAQAGDIVLMVDDFKRVEDAYNLSRRVMFIARQSIFVGIGLSVMLMVIATAGYIRPVVGALLQEVVDVAVILNALRVLNINPKQTI